MTHRLIAVLLSASLFGLALVLVACGSDSSDDSSSPSSTATSSSSPSGSAEVCDALSALSDDVKSMTTASSLSEFEQGFHAAQRDFARVKPAASAAYGPEVDAVQQALDDFGKALQSVGQGGAGSSLQRLGTAAVQLGSAVQQLVTDLPCPSTGSG